MQPGDKHESTHQPSPQAAGEPKPAGEPLASGVATAGQSGAGVTKRFQSVRFLTDSEIAELSPGIRGASGSSPMADSPRESSQKSIGHWRERWQDRWFTGHVSFGPSWFNVTIYGANAMHWAINVWVGWWRTHLCFHPTTRTFGSLWRWYFYISPNATPWAATFKMGPGCHD